ncbi:MAG: hypothetical protein AAGF56_07655 [Pseudomonadota bacterium]
MVEVYEYRRARGKGAIWLAAVALAVMSAGVLIYDAYELFWLAAVFGALALTWMVLPKPVSGIRVDAEYLVLSAWQNPKYVPLVDIAHLRATRVSLETEVAIVYKDGKQEAIFAGDLPDIDILVSVMAARGIPVRDVYQDLSL